MDHSWVLNYFNEFFGTMILILFGNGLVANSFLKVTTGNPGDTKANGGWVLISFSFGFGVMIPAMLFGSIAINPAVTLATAVAGTFPWVQVAPYLFCQVLGAICGQLLVVAIYWPYFRQTTNPELVFACFFTFDHAHNIWNGFVTEVVGTAVMMFVAIGLMPGFRCRPNFRWDHWHLLL